MTILHTCPRCSSQSGCTAEPAPQNSYRSVPRVSITHNGKSVSAAFRTGAALLSDPGVQIGPGVWLGPGFLAPCSFHCPTEAFLKVGVTGWRRSTAHCRLSAWAARHSWDTELGPEAGELRTTRLRQALPTGAKDVPGAAGSTTPESGREAAAQVAQEKRNEVLKVKCYQGLG